LGAALAVWHRYLGNERRPVALDSQQGSYLGPSYSNEQVREYLDSIGANYRQLEPSQVPQRVAAAIDDGLVVGLLQGRMEFGPRALGARSILADARDPEIQSRLNLAIKFREGFRPFAPAVLREDVAAYFKEDCESPYMLLVEPIRNEIRRQPPADEQHLTGIDRLRWVKSTIPAVTHVDYTGRLQTVSADRNGRFYDILRAFKERTGCGVIVNTSFNIRGEPIVNSPEQAYRCFMFTDMDMLVLEDCVLFKKDQPLFPGVQEYRAQFGKD
jgi:carbamoyltransferase